MENTEYDVTVRGSVSSLTGGCAYINYNASDTLSQSYSLWFGNIQHTGPQCRGHGTCNNYYFSMIQNSALHPHP